MSEETVKETRGRKRGSLGFDKEKIFKIAFNTVNSNKLIFLKDIQSYLPCTYETFRNYFPRESIEHQRLIKRINKNRVLVKSHLFKKMIESDDPRLIISAYKLVANKEELARLSNSSYLRRTETNTKIEQPLFDISNVQNTLNKQTIEQRKIETEINIDLDNDFIDDKRIEKENDVVDVVATVEDKAGAEVDDVKNSDDIATIQEDEKSFNEIPIEKKKEF